MNTNALKYRAESSSRKYTVSEVITVLLSRGGGNAWSDCSKYCLAWEHEPSGGSQRELYFFLADVLVYMVEYPLNLSCNISFSICCFFCQITCSLYDLILKVCSQFPKSFVILFVNYSQILIHTLICLWINIHTQPCSILLNVGFHHWSPYQDCCS